MIRTYTSVSACAVLTFLVVLFVGGHIFLSHAGAGLRVSQPKQSPPSEVALEERLLQMHMVIPAFSRDQLLRTFAKRLRPAMEEYRNITAHNMTRIGTFRLIVTRYGVREKQNSRLLRQELSVLSGLTMKQVVFVSLKNSTSTFNRAHSVNLLLRAACHEENCIVSRIDVDMQIKASFFINSQNEVVSGETIYFPIVWSSYHPKSPELVQWHWDIQTVSNNLPRQTMDDYSEHKGHWRDYGTGMWAIGGPDAKIMRLNEVFKGWGGEDTDFYHRVKQQRKVIRMREKGLIHVWHPKMCTRGVTVFTDQQVDECNYSRKGEIGSELGRELMVKWNTQHIDDEDSGATHKNDTRIHAVWRA
ncbi:Chondroitin sulfate synthase 1 [Seminavis robusta]|uniref:Chondroitin sulfate synthase 1 n=1 Tax=Seminavis robusta TaxID=568900 RepID=A0A9N8E5W6_9STRA|nr:Chondroitin sulfate synthase 1 [Seminavis robusta]|eukprot:Sro705_g190320.1 Chondroitin sulfate synthase 1 (359) ;mRNA; r:19870-21026